MCIFILIEEEDKVATKKNVSDLDVSSSQIPTCLDINLVDILIMCRCFISKILMLIHVFVYGTSLIFALCIKGGRTEREISFCRI